MRFIGLARGPAGSTRPSSSLAGSMAYGATVFAIVSVAAYSIWAYHLVAGTGAMYAAIAFVYIGCSGLALSRLVVAPGATGRFALLFAAAFVLYAALWCACWFGLHGKHHADLWGSVAGLAALTWLMHRAFGGRDDFFSSFAVLFLLHTIGYYLGDVLHAILPGAPGRLLWGLAYGAGFGAGLGALLHRCQQPAG